MGELDRAAICQRIGRARTEAGLSQPELAESLHVHWRTVQTWESVKDPRVPWDRLDELATVTSTTKEWLLHGDVAVQNGGLDLGELAARLEAVTASLVDAAHALQQATEAQKSTRGRQN